jgi:4-hydroxythreonine-4-phosphate dehydrogenase
MELQTKPVVAITMGDPAGVGPEICAKAVAESSILDLCSPVIFGSATVWHQLRSKGLVPRDIPTISLAEWRRCLHPPGPILIDVLEGKVISFEPGTVNPACGRAAFEFIQCAINDAIAGKVVAVVTGPINKKALNAAGINYPGHTEIFTSLTRAKRTCMMQWSEELTVTMVTTHVGYADVVKHLSEERIFDVICLTADAMRWMLGREPRIGVCALNPHAGENGLFGYGEEERLIKPAIARARQVGIMAEGPLVPDAAFTPFMRCNYDAFVTMYHDQGHIPFKMLAFDVGVNITLGLPIIRTSVDHGTAFDIAWRGLAKPTSLFQAIKVAVRMYLGRATTVIR